MGPLFFSFFFFAILYNLANSIILVFPRNFMIYKYTCLELLLTIIIYIDFMFQYDSQSNLVATHLSHKFIAGYIYSSLIVIIIIIFITLRISLKCFIIYYSVSSHNITKNNVFISILIFINLNIINRLYDINLSAKDNFSIFFLIVLYIYMY